MSARPATTGVPRDRRRGARSGAVVLIAALIALTVPAGSASAHTEFESSNPADGAVVDGPVDVVTIAFTNPAEPAGEGFVALDQGVVREPTEVVDVDDRTFGLRFDPPLATGQIGIRWSVRAGDAHPISGAFSFTVAGSPPATTPTTTISPATTPAAPSSPAATALDTVTTGTEAGTTLTTTPPASNVDRTGDVAAISLDEFLDTSGGIDGVGRLGRAVTLLAVTVGLGALAFTATALRGTRREVAGALLAVRVAGGLVALGAVIESIGLASATGDAMADVLTTSAGVATLLRFVGGIALAVGLVTAPLSVPPRRALSAAVVDETTNAAPNDSADGGTWSWSPQRRSAFALAGVVAILVSFWFDGHTVTRGWRPLHAVIDTVHVAAGSIWVGGVATTAVLLWVRHRAGRPARAAELVVRFSPIATVALACVGVAGLAMAAIVLDTPGDLFATEWGQVLLLKTAGVAVAAAIGAYNHVVLRPALDAAPGDARLADRVRTSVTAEAIILVFVVVVTATLVAAATV